MNSTGGSASSGRWPDSCFPFSVAYIAPVCENGSHQHATHTFHFCESVRFGLLCFRLLYFDHTSIFSSIVFRFCSSLIAPGLGFIKLVLLLDIIFSSICVSI